jgi:ABC-type Mn2+/Zn2+ transport system permease subunit
MKQIIILSPLIGIICCLVGITISFLIDLPTGASIAIVSSSLFGLSVLLSPKRRRG